MPSNDLYLAVLPIIHLGAEFGKTEQVLTLFPDRKFATAFLPDEVDGYVATFKHRAETYLTGGHVTGYTIFREPIPDGRVIVRVVQDVG